jgi:hypothetical protein
LRIGGTPGDIHEPAAGRVGAASAVGLIDKIQ